MDQRYWERVGVRYEQEIFDSSRSDANGVVRRRLDELADPRAVAWDFGCGVGHYLPLLSQRFRSVHAVDAAESLLAQARARHGRLHNVTIQRGDLAAAGRLPGPKARVALCANVLISADESLRRGILRGLARKMARGGVLLLIVPSLESALFSNQRLVEWNRRLGIEESEALASGIPATARGARELLQGIVRIENVPTKFYLREEASLLLESHGFRLLAADKVEYEWDTEFEKPPRWMGKPRPWDWLFTARFRGR